MSTNTPETHNEAIQSILKKPMDDNITPEEFTMLREFMRMTQAELGEALAEIEPSLRRGRIAVNLYENGRSPVPLRVGQALRLLAARYITDEKRRVASLRVPRKLKRLAEEA